MAFAGRVARLNDMAKSNTRGKATATILFNNANKLDAALNSPLSTDDPRWLQRMAKANRYRALKKEKSLAHKTSQKKNRANRTR